MGGGGRPNHLNRMFESVAREINGSFRRGSSQPCDHFQDFQTRRCSSSSAPRKPAIRPDCAARCLGSRGQAMRSVTYTIVRHLRNFDSRRESRAMSRVSHSHTTRTRQPIVRSLAVLRRSRVLFASSLPFQKAARDLGVRSPMAHLCRCQKQP